MGERLRLGVLYVLCAAGTACGTGTPDASPDIPMADADAGPPEAGPPPTPPLHTNGRFIVDATGRRAKIAAVSWYGAEERDYVPAGLEIADLDAIATLVRALGFDAVRLPWSNEMLESDPMVADAAVAANPTLRGLHAMQVFDAVVAALASNDLLVVLDNHMSTADWCCPAGDGNDLWYDAAFPEASWLADWQAIVGRYLAEPHVVAADLRNEPRARAVWGGTDPTVDWRAAAERGGEAVLSVNPNLLVIVEGIRYATDLSGVAAAPVTLSIPNRLVYSAHDYAWYHPLLSRYDALANALDAQWGYVATAGGSYTAPVWVGEFGTCHSVPACVDDVSGQGFWFAAIRRYLGERDFDFAYWPLDGTQARGAGRTFGAEEVFGLLDTSWSGPALPDLLFALQFLAPATQGP